jgi:arsenic resistance protein ArsH
MLPNHSIDNLVSGLLKHAPRADYKPKILVLFGSLRADSHSRKLAVEVVRMLEHFGAEAKLFEPLGLPIYDGESVEHEKVQELRTASQWSEGQVWISPEIHGNLSAVFKNQIDWLPLKEGAVRSTQGKTLAVMQISGGSQSFNSINSLRILGRWMRMFTIPNQSSIAKAWQEFDKDGKLKDSPYRDRVIDVLEELMKTTLLMRDQSHYLTERFSENKAELQAQIQQTLQDANIETAKPSLKQ